MQLFFKRKFMFCFGFCLFAAAGSAEAHHCRIETPNIDFGIVDPLRIEGTETPASIKLNCWAVTSPTHYCIAVKDAVPEQMLKLHDYEIPFNFYHDNIIFGNNKFGKPIVGTLEPIRGRPTQYPVIPISAKLGRAEGLNLANGIYKGEFRTILYGAYGRKTLSEAEKQAMCEGQRPSGAIVWTEQSQTFSVKATVKKTCSIIADSINFGTVMNLDKTASQSGRVRVKCSAPTHYQIGLSGSDTPPPEGKAAP